MNFVRVALDVPLPGLFDYRATSATNNDIGRRVLVPFGPKIAVGVIVELATASTLPPRRIRAVLNIMRDVPALPTEILNLLKFCSNYYHLPLGATVLNALPSRLRRRQVLKSTSASGYRLTREGRAIDPSTLPPRANVKHKLLDMLRAADGGMDEMTLRTVSSRASAALKTIEALGWIERIELATPIPLRHAELSVASGPELTHEQRVAVDTIRAAREGFAPWLLFGVTGSGKTEVYLQLIADSLARGKQTLLLVPEINLTPQLEGLVRARFPGAHLVSLHSGLNESERLHGWLAAQSGVADIVLGTRLAVFTPLPKLGLIIIDEEQDASFRQSEGLRYSARDLALVRAKQRALTIVMGSATPALETFHKALNGNYKMLALTQRINAMPPDIECIDTRREPLVDGLSQALLRAVRESLQRGVQSLLFINRRGYAPVLICRGCSWTSGCHRCSAKLVLHRKDRCLLCHHCGHREQIPAACPQCGTVELAPLGHGTQRIEDALAHIFPKAHILRIDRDTTRRKHAWPEMRRRIHAQEIDILVGTQIVGKGHDFPQLDLVGVINADSSLYSTDFRASERLFACLTQVAGRAGRGAHQGRVLIQTEFPSHPLYQALLRHDYPAYARQILAERQHADLPPFVHQAMVRAEAPRLNQVLDFLGRAARSAAVLQYPVTVYDPVPAGLTRLAGLERAQLTVQARSRSALQKFLHAWCAQLTASGEHRVRWSLDVDPLEP